MPRLPPLNQLVASVITAGGKKKGVAVSLAYLDANRSALANYATVYDLALAADSDPQAQALVHHMTQIRVAVVMALWKRQIFVGVSVIDDLLFGYLSDPQATDPVRATLEFLRDYGVSQPGLLVFPLHSFGILGAGLWQFVTRGAVTFLQPEWGLAVLPQSDSMQRTKDQLQIVSRAFGIRHEIPREMIDHWRRSRPTGWLERNPLMVLRTVNVSGTYYENEPLLIRKVEAYAGLITLLASLQDRPSDLDKRLASSSMLNNSQTLDLHHYLTLFPVGRRKTLDGYCVPVNLGRPEVVELSDLRVELDPDFWARRGKLAGRAHDAVDTVLSGYFQHSLSRSAKTTSARAYRKLFESLVFFRRSFRRTGASWAGVTSLATAFEMLLTDHYAPGIDGRLVRRTRLLLQGTPGTKRLQGAVSELYRERSVVVHTGQADEAYDLATAREAYARTFIALAERLPHLPQRSATPIGDLVGDTAGAGSA